MPAGIAEAVVPIFDNEPTSVVAYFLTTRPYQQQLNASMKGILQQARAAGVGITIGGGGGGGGGQQQREQQQREPEPGGGGGGAAEERGGNGGAAAPAAAAADPLSAPPAAGGGGAQQQEQAQAQTAGDPLDASGPRDGARRRRRRRRVCGAVAGPQLAVAAAVAGAGACEARV
ncbi:MAG: hypothetical protein J3K34DRAFT_58257 [Monoraphidium minutum]|nr:MAG: hypothetical protein J3K34DRAFT_58257 [Monoraphidium minutum]